MKLSASLFLNISTLAVCSGPLQAEVIRNPFIEQPGAIVLLNLAEAVNKIGLTEVQQDAVQAAENIAAKLALLTTEQRQQLQRLDWKRETLRRRSEHVWQKSVLRC